MALFLARSAARSLAFDLPARADATPTFVVYTPQGGTQQASASVTLDSVNTTLSGAAAAGATSVTVASASGITVGRKYLLTAAEDTGGERVTVKSISSTTITLARPLRLAHASGAAFQSTRVTVKSISSTTITFARPLRLSHASAAAFASTRVTCAVSAITTVARHYRIEVAWSVSSTAQPAFVRTLDVVRYVPESNITSYDDVADYDPVLGKRLPAGTWFPAIREEAWESILDRVAAKVPPGAIVSSDSLSRAHRYLIRMLLAETGGEQWEEYRKRMAARFEDELAAALGAAAIDNDEDGSIESNEGYFRGLDILRA